MQPYNNIYYHQTLKTYHQTLKTYHQQLNYYHNTIIAIHLAHSAHTIPDIQYTQTQYTIKSINYAIIQNKKYFKKTLDNRKARWYNIDIAWATAQNKKNQIFKNGGFDYVY